MRARAVIVSVGYDDLLAVTLPWNRHHFLEVLVVTSRTDADTVQVAVDNRCFVYRTDAFTAQGAAFNKWLALEEALDAFGRLDWLCILDADVFLPKELPKDIDWREGFLYTPLRRMAPLEALKDGVPAESEWGRYPIHSNFREWAGYCQIFSAYDPALGAPPWHPVDIRHGGRGDSYFQGKWSWKRKVRPSFEVLHVGPARENWFGRATPRLDGREVPGAEERRDEYKRMRKLSREERSVAERLTKPEESTRDDASECEKDRVTGEGGDSTGDRP
jgi:hypothetical protein